jgi:hypothetical protein
MPAAPRTGMCISILRYSIGSIGIGPSVPTDTFSPMISFRQLLVIAVVIGLVWLFYQLRQRLDRTTGDRPPPEPPAGRFQDTVRCRRCGVYLPRAEARGDDRRGYTCADPDCLTDRARPGH